MSELRRLLVLYHPVVRNGWKKSRPLDWLDHETLRMRFKLLLSRRIGLFTRQIVEDHLIQGLRRDVHRETAANSLPGPRSWLLELSVRGVSKWLLSLVQSTHGNDDILKLSDLLLQIFVLNKYITFIYHHRCILALKNFRASLIELCLLFEARIWNCLLNIELLKTQCWRSFRLVSWITAI